MTPGPIVTRGPIVSMSTAQVCIDGQVGHVSVLFSLWVLGGNEMRGPRWCPVREAPCQPRLSHHTMEHPNLRSEERGVGGVGKIAAEVTPPALAKAAAAIVTTSIRAQGTGACRDP